MDFMPPNHIDAQDKYGTTLYQWILLLGTMFNYA